MSTATAVATGHHASTAAACTEVKAYRSGQTRVVADVEVGPQTRGSLAAAAGRVPARSVWPTPPGLGGGPGRGGASR